MSQVEADSSLSPTTLSVDWGQGTKYIKYLNCSQAEMFETRHLRQQN